MHLYYYAELHTRNATISIFITIAIVKRVLMITSENCCNIQLGIMLGYVYEVQRATVSVRSVYKLADQPSYDSPSIRLYFTRFCPLSDFKKHSTYRSPWENTHNLAGIVN